MVFHRKQGMGGEWDGWTGMPAEMKWPGGTITVITKISWKTMVGCWTKRNISLHDKSDLFTKRKWKAWPKGKRMNWFPLSHLIHKRKSYGGAIKCFWLDFPHLHPPRVVGQAWDRFISVILHTDTDMLLCFGFKCSPWGHQKPATIAVNWTVNDWLCTSTWTFMRFTWVGCRYYGCGYTWCMCAWTPVYLPQLENATFDF